MWLIIMLLIFGSVAVFSFSVIPPIYGNIEEMNKRRSRELAERMDEMFIKVRVRRVILFYTVGPIILAVTGFMAFPAEIKLLGVVAGAVVGFLAPSVYVKFLTQKRTAKFEDQLVDTLMILSSSLKGGLSLIQALEVVKEEMPAPVSQEFGTLLGENKMGISLEESFARLYSRMPSTALHHMITAILLARETGGNLPVIFSRIVTTIRENKKIKQNIDNLTLQGKIQGVVMSILPIAFAAVVTSSNKNFFDQLINSDVGRMLLILAVFLEVLGVFMIWRISTFKEF
ncbi:MAG TPA: type II secretion system F family protein [Candidatus Omnitrophota bacterium]|nr:type II secretion system F family protein [Candidatus Omnitrophota bacterium]HPD84634.1 type II secretion system F family protein [Candidatus Omnitrophota bacterium]HRZ03492.1 type II secretion system F family protein [Candidatus Omnitrophota bacterium]